VSKTVYLDVKYVIVTRNYDFFMYTQNLIENITLSIGIILVAALNCDTKQSERYGNVASHSL